MRACIHTLSMHAYFLLTTLSRAQAIGKNVSRQAWTTTSASLSSENGSRRSSASGWPRTSRGEEEEEEEGFLEEESLLKADALNEEDPERDRATQV